MLQLISTPPAQGALPTDAAVLPASSPAGFNAPMPNANPQGFALNAEALLAVAPLGEVLPGAVEDTPLDPALLSATTDDSSTPEPTDALAPLLQDPSLQQQELSAEQWLLSMLGQRQLTVQARDGDRTEGAAQPQTNAVSGQGSAQPLIPAVVSALNSATDNSVTPLPVAKKDDDSDALTALLATLGSSAEPTTASITVDSASSQAVSALSGAATPATSTQPQDLSQAQLPQLERHLKLQAPEAKWGEQMLAALKDNVELQLQQKVQSATIRLDPPELGSMEILLSHESGRLSVQIAASNGDVARLLNTTSERLRQELVGQNFLQVNVQVSSDSSGQQGQQHARQRLPVEEAILAAAPSSEPEQRQGKTGDDVLVTV